MQVEIDLAPAVLGAVFYFLYRCFAPKMKFSLPEDHAKKIECEVFSEPVEHDASEVPTGEPEPEEVAERPSSSDQFAHEATESTPDRGNRKMENGPKTFKIVTTILVVGVAMSCANWNRFQDEVLAHDDIENLGAAGEPQPAHEENFGIAAGTQQKHVVEEEVPISVDPNKLLREGTEQKHLVEEAVPMSINPNNLLTINLTRQQMQYSQKGVSFFKSAFWGAIRVGNPQQEFRVLVDTGSGHLVLPSTYCSSETCRAHRRYRRSRSDSAIDIDGDGTPVVAGAPRDQLTVSFGTGHITGVFVDDIMCLRVDGWQEKSDHNDGLPPGCMRMRIIITTEMSEDPFKQFHFDGILGLGLEPLAQAPRFNFMTVLSEELRGKPGVVPEIFSVFLAANSKENSAVFLGGYHKDRMDSELRWSPVLHPEQGHWMVQITSMSVDGEPVTFCKEGCRAAVDTGTSLLAVPTKAFPEVFELLRHPVPDAGKCQGQGPKLEIVLEGGIQVVLEPEDFSRRDYVRSQGRKWGDGQGKVQRNTYCKPMLMAMDIPEPIGPKLFILGEPVLRKYYTVYDTAKFQVGFSRAKHIMEVESDNSNDDSWFLDD